MRKPQEKKRTPRAALIIGFNETPSVRGIYRPKTSVIRGMIQSLQRIKELESHFAKPLDRQCLTDLKRIYRLWRDDHRSLITFHFKDALPELDRFEPYVSALMNQVSDLDGRVDIIMQQAFETLQLPKNALGKDLLRFSLVIEDSLEPFPEALAAVRQSLQKSFVMDFPGSDDARVLILIRDLLKGRHWSERDSALRPTLRANWEDVRTFLDLTRKAISLIRARADDEPGIVRPDPDVLACGRLFALMARHNLPVSRNINYKDNHMSGQTGQMVEAVLRAFNPETPASTIARAMRKHFYPHEPTKRATSPSRTVRRRKANAEPGARGLGSTSRDVKG